MRTLSNILITGLLPGLFALGACEEPIDWGADSRSTDLLVVEGSITNEKSNHLVQLSLTNGRSNEPRIPATGANVFITDSEVVFPLTEFPPGSGFYYTQSNARALFGKTYVLLIQYQGRQYFAADSPVPVEPLSPLTYRPTDSGLYTINFQRGSEPSMTQYLMTWENTSYCSTSGEICFAKILDYDLKTVDVNELFKPAKEQVNFPILTIVVREKHSVSDIYRRYLRALLSETEWRGGSFDVERGNVITNLSEGAVGFFAATTVVKDTSIVLPL